MADGPSIDVHKIEPGSLIVLRDIWLTADENGPEGQAKAMASLAADIERAAGHNQFVLIEIGGGIVVPAPGAAPAPAPNDVVHLPRHWDLGSGARCGAVLGPGTSWAPERSQATCPRCLDFTPKPAPARDRDSTG